MTVFHVKDFSFFNLRLLNCAIILTKLDGISILKVN